SRTSTRHIVMNEYRKTQEAIDRLTPLQRSVTQDAATERPFTGEYYEHDEPGLYVDVVTGEPLFTSRDKFHSSCGWPSFSKPVAGESVNENRDMSHGMIRT